MRSCKELPGGCGGGRDVSDGSAAVCAADCAAVERLKG